VTQSVAKAYRRMSSLGRLQPHGHLDLCVFKSFKGNRLIKLHPKDAASLRRSAERELPMTVGVPVDGVEVPQLGHGSLIDARHEGRQDRNVVPHRSRVTNDSDGRRRDDWDTQSWAAPVQRRSRHSNHTRILRRPSHLALED